MTNAERYGPNVSATRVEVTDFDAGTIGIMLSMLAERHTDAEILAMLTPKKMRAALLIVRKPPISPMVLLP